MKGICDQLVTLSVRSMLGLMLCLPSVSCFHTSRETLVSHSFSHPRLGEKSFTSYDQQSFPYRKFLCTSANAPPIHTVVIGIHGFCGASIDYENLGHWLVQHQPQIALYAYDIRGQGFDPIVARRGDIDDPKHWFRDLITFTQLVQNRHPDASVVWQGESMGALILAHTYRNEMQQSRTPPCDAIIMTSPVVSTRHGLPPWKKESLRLMAKTFPNERVSLDTLAGGRKIAMTSSTFHQEQAEVNAWNIERHSLRLLLHLGNLIDQMPACASTFQVPTLLVYGGKDFFTTSQEVQFFYQQISKTHRKKKLFYPNSHHLLMYDQDKDRVLRDIGHWLAGLKQGSADRFSYK